ncbi:hypothetical protein BH09MYX1_BH09MYX1_12580 [soil metagenome]
MRKLGFAFLLPLPFFVLVHCSPSDATVDADAASTCPTPTGAPIEHKDAISADATWSADSTHLVTFNLSVAKGATLTIAPCAVVKFKAGYSIVVDGNLFAEGTATKPMQFLADDAIAPWGDLQVFAPGTMKLAYATVSDAGGDTSNSFAAIEARGDQLLAAQEIVKVDHVTVKNSAAYGVSLRAGGAFTKDSQALTITGSKKAPLRVLPRLVTNIPVGTYTGNADDSIVIAPESYGDVDVEDVTLHDRGVPYHVGDASTGTSFAIGPHHYTLTIEPGVTLAFGADGLIETKNGAGATGVLIAKGTAEKPIVFTTTVSPPIAGSWRGIVFGRVADAANALDHVAVRFAGGPSQANSAHCETDGTFSKNEDAAVAIYAQPSAFIKNSVFESSAGAGIDLAYDGDYVDVKSSNSFVSHVSACPVTRPRSKNGACSPDACP